MERIHLLVLLLLSPIWVQGETVGHVTRDYFGDIFSLEDCQPGSCEKDGRRAAEIPGEKCRCQCAPSHYTFREDMRQCIKDVGECPVAMFVRPFAVEKMPLVFLPMTGQLVYPGAHLTVSGIARLAPTKHLSCNVKASLLMTSRGWQPIRTMTQIFGVYYDGNKTFLQWLGNDEDRRGLQHHLVLIRLQCEGENNNGSFEPCAALRIGWAPGLEQEFGEQTSNKTNFIIIGLCLGILGLVYVGAVLIYLKVRKNRRLAARQNGSQENTIETIEDVNCERRNAYINNLVQEAELTSKTSKSGSNHSSATENGMKSLDVLHRKPDLHETNHAKSNGQSTTIAETHACTSSDSPEDTASLQPPPQEFFMRIRGMISAAKNRLNSFRYKPTLLVIPEDDYFYQDFKEKDMESSGNRKSTYRKFSKKGGNSSTSSKVESIHGSKFGAAMLESKLAPPLPPPRNAKPKSKKRAPSPPGEISLPDYERESPSPASLKELGGSLDRKKSRKMSSSPTGADNYSKFDLFRMDLYEKIHRMREGSPVVDSDIVLEYSENKNTSKGDETFEEETSNSQGPDNKENDDATSNTVQYASIQQDSKISRRQLLHKLQEAETKSTINTSDDERLETRASSTTSEKRNRPSSEREDDDIDDDWAPSHAGSVVEELDVKDLGSLPYSSRPGTAMSNSSARTTSSQPSTMKENKPVLKESLSIDIEEEDNLSNSETSEASLSGDSLNSSFRKPQKSPAALKVKCQRSSEDLSVISGSSVITSSTAIKEIEDYDDDDLDDDTTQDSRQSTDLDAEMYSLDESEHPSLEEFLQLSTQVAKKLSERTVPVFNSDSPKEKNVISQFMKEFKTTIGRLKTDQENRPRSSRNASPGSDNWTLKREEKRAKVARRVSIFKRNPLKGRKNEEPLVNEEKSGYYDINAAVETDDATSSRSSTASSMSGKKGRQRYKVKTPEIVPATKVIDGGEKTVISITNEPNQNGAMDFREITRYTPSPVSKTGKAKFGKAVSPPLPPPKPHIDPQKLKNLKSLKKSPDIPDKIERELSPVSNGTEGNCDMTADTEDVLKNTSNKRNGKHPRFVRTPSIESDSISIANSDMTEDSLNTPIPDESEEENPDLSEDENGPIDRCLAQLADSVIQPTDDCSLNRYLSQLGTALAVREELPVDQCLNKLANNVNINRATKGFNVSLHLPLCTWEHVCVDKGSDRSTPTSDRSSTTSRGSHGSQENLRKKTLSKSKHHHHHHRSSECRHSNSNGDIPMNTLETLNHLINGHHHFNGIDPITARMMIERANHKGLLKGKHHIASTSEEDECGRASSLGSTRELETVMSETTSDPGSADLVRPRKKRQLLRRSKKGLNGTCRQHIQNSKFNKKENGSLRKGGFQHRTLSTPRSSESDVTVIQLEGDSHENVTNVESSSTFVTLINVDSSDCSNSAEEK